MGNEKLVKCPFCREMVREKAIKCYHCRSWIQPGTAILSPCYRPTDGRTLWGVCAGIAKKFGVDVTIVRLVFIGLALFGGHGLLLYIILRLLMPEEPEGTSAPAQQAA